MINIKTKGSIAGSIGASIAKKLDTYDKRLTKGTNSIISSSLRKVANKFVKKRMKALAPKNTGLLRKNIITAKTYKIGKKRVRLSPQSIAVGISDGKAFYGVFLDEGTKKGNRLQGSNFTGKAFQQSVPDIEKNYPLYVEQGINKKVFRK